MKDKTLDDAKRKAYAAAHRPPVNGETYSIHHDADGKTSLVPTPPKTYPRAYIICPVRNVDKSTELLLHDYAS